MQKDKKIYIAGHKGLVGSAILRNLKNLGFNNFVLRTFNDLDLTKQSDVENFFQKEQPAYVILAAAKVGGIVANNTYRAQFIYENLMIQNNVIHAAYKTGVEKLLFLGSSCIYPKLAPQPLKENSLLTGTLEYTNEPYAIAKIAGIKMCESYYKQYGCNFISVMPTNLYGPNDNYDLEKSHVLPALIRKMHLGKCLETNNWESILTDLRKKPIGNLSDKNSKSEILDSFNKLGVKYKTKDLNKNYSNVNVEIWGTGKVFREFLHVDDMADACAYIMNHVESQNLYNDLKQTHINIGTGEDISIKDLANVVKQIVGFHGELVWNKTKPDGTPKKQLDVSLIHSLGWKHSIELKQGILNVYKNYQI